MLFDNISRFLQYSISTKNLLSFKNRNEFERYYHSSIQNLDKYSCKNYLKQTEEILELIEKNKKLKILDIGTGCGTEAIWFAMNNAVVTSIDIKTNRLDVALERKEILENQFNLKLDLKLINLDFFEFYEKCDHEIFDVIWMEQAYHHIEPREKLIPALRNLLKKNGYLIFSESNALNPFLQLSLFIYRMFLFKSLLGGFKTVDKWVAGKGKNKLFGVERITRKSTLKKVLEKNNFEIISSKFFRVLPNKIEFRSFNFIERIPPKILPFIFSHYNLVARKK